MNDRFIKLMQHFNLSPSLFADEIGVNRPAISHIMSGRNKPGVDLIQKVLKRFPEVSTDWLLMGTGSMLHTGAAPQQVTKIPETIIPKEEPKDLFSYTERERIAKEAAEENKNTKEELVINSGKKSQIKRITIYFTDGSFKDFEEVN